MEKKSKYAAIIVVAVIVVAAVGIYFLTNNKEDPNKVTFLIQDEEGVYFWSDGSGETARDALADAFSDYEEGTLVLNQNGIKTLFGKGTQKIGDDYIYWVQFVWADNEWTFSDLSLLNITSSDVDYILVMYGVSTMAGVEVPDGTPVPKDAKVWNGNEKGTVFTVASDTGLYFKVNGNSKESLIRAFESACNEYKIPLKLSKSEAYGDGINTLFDRGTIDVGGTWVYWGQYAVEDNKWASSPLGMASLKCEDNPKFLVQYGSFGTVPTVPV